MHTNVRIFEHCLLRYKRRGGMMGASRHALTLIRMDSPYISPFAVSVGMGGASVTGTAVSLDISSWAAFAFGASA